MAGWSARRLSHLGQCPHSTIIRFLAAKSPISGPTAPSVAAGPAGGKEQAASGKRLSNSWAPRTPLAGATCERKPLFRSFESPSVRRAAPAFEWQTGCSKRLSLLLVQATCPETVRCKRHNSGALSKNVTQQSTRNVGQPQTNSFSSKYPGCLRFSHWFPP